MPQCNKTMSSQMQLLCRTILFAGLLFVLVPCNGQEANFARTESDSLYRHISREMSAEWSCHFTYAQGKGTLSSDLGNNAEELEKLDTFIRHALAHPTLYLSRIRLTGYSSVEGGYARNESLARQRVQQFYLYLQEFYPELYHYPHSMAWVAEDWSSLSARIKASQLKERDDILDIISRIPVYDTREALLMKLNGGRPWLFMEREFFPGLRRVELGIEYSTTPLVTIKETPLLQPAPKEREPDHAASDSITTISDLVSDSISAAPDSLSSGAGRVEAPARIRFALKTNLLLWAGVQSDFRYTAPVINAALEYYINDHWSVEAGAMYSYWHYNSGKEFQGISGYRLEPRYRYAFPGDRFEAYLGIYGRMGDYDSQTVDSSQLTVDSDNAAQPTVNYQLPTVNYTGDYWDAGLSAGVSIRLIGNLGVEAGVRAGYVSSDPYKYTRDNYYNWFDSRWRYWKVGITDLNMSLIYRFH
jgi:hypothetical protein